MKQPSQCPKCFRKCNKLLKCFDEEKGEYLRCTLCTDAFEKNSQELRDESRWMYKFVRCPQCFCLLSAKGTIRKKDTKRLTQHECKTCFRKWMPNVSTLPIHETFELIMNELRAYQKGISSFSKEVIIKHCLRAIETAPLVWDSFLYEECDNADYELLKRFYDEHVYVPIPLESFPPVGLLDYFQETGPNRVPSSE